MLSRLRKSRISILIVPEKEGAVFSFKVSLLLLRAAIIAAVAGVILFVIIFFSWANLARKAAVTDKIRRENEEFAREQERVAQLQSRVERLTMLEEKIRKALGADIALDGTNPPSSNVPVQWDSAGAESSGEYAAAKPEEFKPRETPYQFNDLSVLNAGDLPSLWPLRGYITRGFEVDPVVPSHSHTGVDIAAGTGTVVKATAGGVVVWTGWSPLYGNVVLLAHASGYFSFYGHNQMNLVKPKDRVERGTPIALLGNTGKSSAPHLHFEIWHESQPLDPAELLMPF
jgi:murein DD-endopeptidase MepM/ murein hydrolase activator NlpD